MQRRRDTEKRHTLRYQNKSSNEQKMMQTSKNTGLFICSGCGIGDCIDVGLLKDTMASEFTPSVCENHSSLCSENGISQIRSSIAENKLNSLVIAACSPRFKQESFTFDQQIINERVNLREQLAWCQIPGEEDTQMLAEDMIRMSMVKVARISIPEPYIPDKLSPVVLVVGGGVSGVAAAAAGAAAGYKIVLIEREEVLGGWANKLYKQLPYKSPFKKPQDLLIDEKINRISNDERIDIHTSTTIQSISGEPGKYEVTLTRWQKDTNDTSSATDVIKVGSIVLASGWQPYDPSSLSKYKYDQFENVISSIELEEMAKSGSIHRPSDNKPVENVLFIQCAGSRDSEHLPYCSSVCCATTLKQTTYIRERNKNANIFVIYKDIRMPGHHERFYQEIQKDEQLFITKGEVASISESKEEFLVEVNNTLI